LNVVFGKGQRNQFSIGRFNQAGKAEYSEFEYHDIRDIDRSTRQAL
jgi:hypothetical protein